MIAFGTFLEKRHPQNLLTCPYDKLIINSLKIKEKGRR